MSDLDEFKQFFNKFGIKYIIKENWDSCNYGRCKALVLESNNIHPENKVVGYIGFVCEYYFDHENESFLEVGIYE